MRSFAEMVHFRVAGIRTASATWVVASSGATH